MAKTTTTMTPKEIAEKVARMASRAEARQILAGKVSIVEWLCHRMRLTDLTPTQTEAVHLLVCERLQRQD